MTSLAKDNASPAVTDAALEGAHVRLEPLSLAHVEGLVAAAGADPSLYKWASVPQGVDAMKRYVETAQARQKAGTAMAFATVRQSDAMVLGSTRFWDIERWAWPKGHDREARAYPDACEIGYTWLGKAALRTAANTEAKWLMLSHAFEKCGMLRACFHTDVRNERSRAALERIGARFEGILRSHRLAADNIPRDSARYSITAGEWPGVKERLEALLTRVPA